MKDIIPAIPLILWLSLGGCWEATDSKSTIGGVTSTTERVATKTEKICGESHITTHPEDRDTWIEMIDRYTWTCEERIQDALKRSQEWKNHVHGDQVDHKYLVVARIKYTKEVFDSLDKITSEDVRGRVMISEEWKKYIIDGETDDSKQLIKYITNVWLPPSSVPRSPGSTIRQEGHRLDKSPLALASK